MPRPGQTFTPDLMASGRYRYEQTDEYVHLIAQDFGVSRSHFDRLVTRWGWTKRADRPARDLPAARRILMDASQALVDSVAAPPDASAPPAAADMPSAPALTVLERLERAVERELTAVEIMRRALGPQPQSAMDAERTARTLATLTETLARVQRLRTPTASRDEAADDVDLPADIDAFRLALARRIELFVRGRPDRALSGAGEPDGAGAPE